MTSIKKQRLWCADFGPFVVLLVMHKISQRRVKFPFELDVLDLVTPELKEKLLPLNTKLKEVEKERDERRKVRRKIKAKAKQDALAKTLVQGPSTSSPGDVVMEPAGSADPVPGVIEDEPAARKREAEALTPLIHPDLAADVGCSPHGLYELCGMWCILTTSAFTNHICRYCYTQGSIG